MSAATLRDQETVRKVCGVRTNPEHWANATVHSFQRWTGDTTLTTWCGLTVDLADKGRQTRELISCVQCGQASWQAFHGRTR